MDVEVCHLLAAVLAHVGEQPIALCLQPEILRDLARRAHEPGNPLVTRGR